MLTLKFLQIHTNRIQNIGTKKIEIFEWRGAGEMYVVDKQPQTGQRKVVGRVT